MSCGALEALPAACRRCGQLLEPHLPDRLLALRRLRGLVQREVARRIHVHDSIFALWDAGRRTVPVRWLAALAAAFEAPVWLLANDPDPMTCPLAAGPRRPVGNEPAPEPEPSGGPSGREEPDDRSSSRPPARVYPSGRREVYTVEVSCPLSGRAAGELISATLPFPPVVAFRAAGTRLQRAVVWRRLRCDACGGNTWMDEVQRRWVYLAVDWSLDRPRRGRPPRRSAPG